MRLHLAENLTNSYYVEFLDKAEAPNLLFSYETNKDYKKANEILAKYKHAKNIIIDSGAYSAWTKGAKIDVKELGEYYKNLKSGAQLYFVNLDVIPGSYGIKPTQSQIEKSAQDGWDNMIYLESLGLKVIPVFHQHEDMKWLTKLAKHTDYIGISPANDVTTKQRIAWLDKVFSIIKDTVKTHGFGATAKSILMRYPWFSCDSTSWKATQRFGMSITANYKKIGLHRQPGHFMKLDLSNEIQRWIKLEKMLTELWAKRGVVWL